MGRSVHGQYDPGHHHQRRHARAGCSLAGRGHAGTQHRHRADAGQVGSVVFSLRDGTQLCQAYQCRTKKNCPRGAHRCGVVLQSGRVCGFKQPCDTQWAAPLPGGGEANRWTLLSFTTFVPFWMSWSPLTCTSPKPHHALPSLTFSAVSMPPCPRPFWVGDHHPDRHRDRQDLDVSRPAVRRAIREVLPRVATIPGAKLRYQISGQGEAPRTSSTTV